MPRFSVLLLAVLALTCACSADDDAAQHDDPSTSPPPQYVGSATCAQCHADEFQAWQDSHHQLAMQQPSPETVVGDFDEAQYRYAEIETAFQRKQGSYSVSTDSATGELADYSVRYVFGVYPLQQYLLDLPGGRLQALGLAWDARDSQDGGQRWMHLYPDEDVDHTDPLHWAGAAGNWNFMCADCHSTAVRKNYNAANNVYATEFAEISVGCEACHGPGQAHVESQTPMPALAEQAAQMNTCGTCHSRRSQLAEGFAPGDSLFDFYSPSLLDEGLYHADGQILDEVYVYGSFAQSAMHSAGVSCSDCHDPHSATVKLEGDEVCTQCHSPAGSVDFPSAPRDDFSSASHRMHEAPVACVDCHMPARTYMQVDDRRDHSFRVPRPDLTTALGVPNACKNCHEDRGAQWAASAIGEHDAAPTPHFGTLLAAARAGNPDAERGLSLLSQDGNQAGIVRGTALSLLGQYQQQMSSAAIEAGLRDADPLVQIGALRGARRWTPARLYEKTKRLMTNEPLAVRAEAMQGLVSAYPGLSQSAQQDAKRFLDEYKQLLGFVADSAPGQSNMAAVHMALGDVEAAQAALKRALRLNPLWVPALVNLADVYRAIGKDAQAGDLLGRALEVAADLPDVLLAKALWDVRQGDAAAALPLLERAYRIDELNPRYAYVYIVALHSNERVDDAVEIAQAYLAKRESDQIRQLLQGMGAP